MNSTYWANKIMKQIYTDNTDEFWLGLSSTLPNADGSALSEPGNITYRRVQITGFSEPDNGVVRNVSELTFPMSEGAWFTSDSKAAYWVLFDGSDSDANILSAGKLETPVTIETKTTITVAANAFGLTLADDISIT